MKRYRIGTLPGDGIGPEVVREGKKVLNAVGERYGIEFDWLNFPYSGEHYIKTGEMLPDHALDEMKRLDALFLGAIGHPKLKPGIVEKGILLRMRFHFDQYINLRPIKLYEGVPCPIVGKTAKDINFYVVRENTEDFYIGSGGTLKQGTPDEFAFQIGIITRKGAERVIKYAFELAKRKGMTRVTSCDKANVLTDVYGLWRNVFEEVGSDYPDVEREYNFVDAMTQWFIRKPEWYQVIVSPNMFGDIITDLGAALQGGMGLAPGGNINPTGLSMFEPIHGSAPKYAGQNKANPMAAILAGAMMLDHLGETSAANAVEKAVQDVLREGKVLTYDLGGTARNYEVGDEICRKIGDEIG